ncbi:hypothetical protein NAU58_07520 [Pseudomonas stutzeri]|uniref:Uncharacterized protein n=1 Tax=Stutzerimonas stutzeri TaxID=316 RepID=A0A2N8S0A7_STUST|nr:hypothetical protein [Stutzerimonas stutzeri]MCQ4295421.1 hypothetical protein [Stutzerimonas stutzeri]PNF80067.1 hypothetical protein CXK92_15770 [Stutzerimonas stutzeri]
MITAGHICSDFSRRWRFIFFYRRGSTATSETPGSPRRSDGHAGGGKRAHETRSAGTSRGGATTIRATQIIDELELELAIDLLALY